MTLKGSRLLKMMLAGISILVSANIAHASYLFEFEKLSNNAPVDYSSQYSVQLDNIGGNALFTVNNASTLPSSITGVYFEFGDLIVDNVFTTDSDAEGVTTDGVEFLFPGSPDHLPGGGGYFDNPADFGGHTNGIADGIDTSDEYLKVLAILSTGYDDLLTAIGDGTFRIGLHVQGILPDQNDWSDAYISTVPVPAAAWLFGSALIGFIATSRRRKK